MTTTTSAIPAFKSALVDALIRRTGLAGVQILSAPEFKEIAYESIQFHDVSGDQEWAGATRNREEEFDVDGMVWAAKPGSDEAIYREVRDRAFALLAEVEDELRTSPRVGNTVRLAEVTHIETTEGADPEQGRVCRIDFKVHVGKRLPR